MAQPPSSPSDPPKPLEMDEKASSTPQTSIETLESPEPASEAHGPTTSINGALLDLLCGGFLPCIPVVLVSTLLLTLILYHRVDLDPGWQQLQIPTSNNVSYTGVLSQTMGHIYRGGHAAYYVRFNPAILATIAAWSSKLIPYITGYLMAVVAFFAARRIMDASKDGKPDDLPTPHQMSILIDVLGTINPKSLWNTIMYRWNNHHERLVQPVPLAFGALSYIVIITFLIMAADTWFGTTVKPENVELLSRHLTPVSTYGRDINSSMCGDDIFEQRPCPSNSQSTCSYPCSIGDWNITAGGGVLLKEGIKGAQQAAEALLGNSDVNLIQNTSYVANQQDYDAQQYYFLSDINIGQSLDFLGNTTAVTTQCEVVTQNCQVNTTSEGFSCPGYQSSLGYSGEVGVDPSAATAPGNMSMVGIQFFKDAALQNPIGFGSQSTELFSAQNPVHFLTWSKGFPPVDTTSQTFAAMNQGKYLQVDQAGDNVFILNCSTTIYKTVYAWVNGTILQDNQKYGFYPELAPDTYGAIFSAPFAIDAALGHMALQNAAALAAYVPNPQGLADKFANQFSYAAVALTAGIMSPETSILEQSRNNTELLTRVPLAPLYFLISLKALFALSAILLALSAAWFTGPSEAQEVKARLTVDGLATGLFEPRANHEKAVKETRLLYGEHRPEIQEESSKVGMRQAPAGGWVWVASGAVQKAWTARSFGDGMKTVVDNHATSGKSDTAGKDHEVLKQIM